MARKSKTNNQKFNPEPEVTLLIEGLRNRLVSYQKLERQAKARLAEKLAELSVNPFHLADDASEAMEAICKRQAVEVVLEEIVDAIEHAQTCSLDESSAILEHLTQKLLDRVQRRRLREHHMPAINHAVRFMLEEMTQNEFAIAVEDLASMRSARIRDEQGKDA